MQLFAIVFYRDLLGNFVCITSHDWIVLKWLTARLHVLRGPHVCGKHFLFAWLHAINRSSNHVFFLIIKSWNYLPFRKSVWFYPNQQNKSSLCTIFCSTCREVLVILCLLVVHCCFLLQMCFMSIMVEYNDILFHKSF